MSEQFEPFGSYGTVSRKGQYETLCELYNELDAKVQDPEATSFALENARREVVKHVLDMAISFDQTLHHLRYVGVGLGIASEEEWLDVLGLGPGAIVEFGENYARRLLISDAGMTLNQKLGSDVKPYVWFTNSASDLQICGAQFARDGLMQGVRVVRRSCEVVSKIDGRSQS